VSCTAQSQDLAKWTRRGRQMCNTLHLGVQESQLQDSVTYTVGSHPTSAASSCVTSIRTLSRIAMVR
jgi:hypothetical protein